MENYEEERVKLTNTQLNKFNPVAKNKTGTILGIKKKHFQDEELSQKMVLTRRQRTKIRNVIDENMSTDIKLSKAEFSKLIQSDGFVHNMICYLGKKVIADFAIPLARDNLTGVVSNLASDTIKIFERKISQKGTIRAGRGFILFISN